MKESNQVIYKIIYYISHGCVLSIAWFLFWQSLLMTARIDFEASEHTYYVHGKAIWIFLGICIMIFFFSKLNMLREKRITKILGGGYLLIVPLFVIMAQSVPQGDAYAVMQIASQIIHGDMSAFEPGNYMYVWPNQNGLLLFFWGITKIFGEENFLIIQFLNAILIDVLYVIVWKYLKYYYRQYLIPVGTGLCMFYPVILYTTFCYGTVVGLVLAILAVVFQQLYFQEKGKKYLILSGAFISIAICIKSNYTIWGIAIGICYIGEWLRDRRRQSIVALGVTLLMIWTGYVASNQGLALVTHGASNHIYGSPMLAYVVMGQQESTRAPGWHNGFDYNIYRDSDWNYDKAVDNCKDQLMIELSNKKDNFTESLVFYAKKIESQWCEPSFQGLWYNREDYKSNVKHSNLFYDITSSSGKVNRISYLGLDIFQSFIYLGIVCYILTDKKKMILKNIGLITFCGGFIFHLIWEGKSSYAFPYFVMVIPYGVVGYINIITKLKTPKCACKCSLSNRIKEAVNTRNKMIIIICILIIGLSGIFPVISEDTDMWNEYVQHHRFVQEGNYKLQLIQNQKILGLYQICFEPEKDWTYEIKTQNGKKWLIVEGEKLMERKTIDETDGYQGWRIERINGGYCFRWYSNPDSVLTYDREGEKILIEKYKENDSDQIWNLLS